MSLTAAVAMGQRSLARPSPLTAVDDHMDETSMLRLARAALNEIDPLLVAKG
jgi:hypothetical protein